MLLPLRAFLLTLLFFSLLLPLASLGPIRMMRGDPVTSVIAPPGAIVPMVLVIPIAIVAPFRMVADPFGMILIHPVGIVATPPIGIAPLMTAIVRPHLAY